MCRLARVDYVRRSCKPERSWPPQGMSHFFVITEDDTGARQQATLAWEWYDEQQSIVDCDLNSPIFLRNIRPLNVPRKNDNLVTQSLNLAYEHPDAWPTAGISNALVAEQVQSG